MYWWDAFARGAERHGLVLKDYDIKAPVDSPEQEELVSGIEPLPYEPGVVEERGKKTSAVTVRPGQNKLREQLLRAYEGCCAVTGCSEPSAVQTAHIRSVENGGPDDIRNAILLESDVHDLWDVGKIYVEPTTYIIRVHPDVEWPDYRKLDGQKISLPRDEKNWPDPKELQYHRTFCDF
jgi:predicted restriction endonuclease